MVMSHMNKSGRPRMVDVSDKPKTIRIATATGKVYLQPGTLKEIQRLGIHKGDVLSVAQVAGVMAAKRVPDLIPMCHPLMLSNVEIDFKEDMDVNEDGQCSISISAFVKTVGQTGVEMEALTAVCGAALTIYDMCKSIDREMVIGNVKLLEKKGGRSGSYRRKERPGKR